MRASVLGTPTAAGNPRSRPAGDRQVRGEKMTYSSTLFKPTPAASGDLTDTQRRNIDRLLDAARIESDSKVLVIGTNIVRVHHFSFRRHRSGD